MKAGGHVVKEESERDTSFTPFLIDIARGRLAQVDPALVLLQLSRSRGPKTTAVLASCSVRENPSDRSDQLRCY